MADLLEQLKRRTAQAHLEVEALSGLMDDALTLEQYGAVLGAFARVYPALEAHLLALPLPAALELPRRLRSGRLRADLAALGLPAAAPLPLPDTFARGDEQERTDAALGAMYVLEGASLGGQVIARRLGGRFGLTPEWGLRFFAGDGEAVGPLWKAFRAALPPAAHDPERVVAGAEATFRVFSAALRQHPLLRREAAAPQRVGA